MGTVELTWKLADCQLIVSVDRIHTGLEMTRILALGAASAAALARSRTMEALVLKRSNNVSRHHKVDRFDVPSRVMPGLRGTPAGMRTISASERASFNPEGVGS